MHQTPSDAPGSNGRPHPLTLSPSQPSSPPPPTSSLPPLTISPYPMPQIESSRSADALGFRLVSSVPALRLAARPTMDLPPLSHQALFAALRSADAEAVRRLLAGAEESALYVPADAEAVRLLLPLYDLEAAKLRSRLDLDAFHVAAKQGHTGEPLFSLD